MKSVITSSKKMVEPIRLAPPKETRFTRESGKKLRLAPIDIKSRSELSWLHRFIHKYHSSPKWFLPTLAELKNENVKYFRAYVVEPKALKGEFVGITSYEIRTRFLAETQKTIIAPEFRGKGWGSAVSWGMEDHIRKKGFRKIRSAVYSNNLPMIQIKLAQGFCIEGFHPDHDAPGLHEYSLGKVLPSKKTTRSKKKA